MIVVARGSGRGGVPRYATQFFLVTIRTECTLSSPVWSLATIPIYCIDRSFI